MNDFTKKELEEIFDSVMFHTDPTNDELLTKIQSMIDNYQCKHEGDGMIYTSHPPQNRCIKCGEFYR